MMPAAGGADHISDLGDDVLLNVLRFLSDDARDVVRTSALSTRWRDLWKCAPVLRLRQHKAVSTNADDARFNDFLHNVLERRASGGADIDRLQLYALLSPGNARANMLLRRAMHLTVGSLMFHLSAFSLRTAVTLETMMVDLPTTTRLAKMSLHLGQAVLQLPPAVEFHKLTELTLGGIVFSDKDGPRLGHLLSSPSCCPRLRKLKLSYLFGLQELRLHGGALETLYLENLQVRRLDVDAPRLSLLHVSSSFMHDCRDEHTSLTVRAPALEKLETSIEPGQLRSQHSTIQLLQECRPINGHTICLSAPDKLRQGEEDDLMTEMPQLPGVKDLTIHFCSKNSHYLGPTVASLLARCNNLEYLHLDNRSHLHFEMKYGPKCKEGCGKCNFRGRWNDNVLSLKRLREVKLGGFSGQEHFCLDMVQLLLTSASALERMILTAKAPELMSVESLESSLPCRRGKWALRHADTVTSEYEWTPHYTKSTSRRHSKVPSKVGKMPPIIF